MSKKNVYKCEGCRKNAEVSHNQDIPECCGSTMKRLELAVCTMSDTAEHARTEGNDICDDGRAGV